MHSRSRHLSSSVILLTFFALFTLLLSACNPISTLGDPNKPLPASHPDRPFLFIHLTPGHSRHSISGVLLAIYPDARIIRATSESTIGQSYIRGRLSPENFAQARRILHDSGLLSTKPGGIVVVDFGAEHLGVRYGNHITSWGHTPGLENTDDADATNPRITKLKNNLLALPIQDPKPEPPAEWHRYPSEFYEGQVHQ